MLEMFDLRIDGDYPVDGTSHWDGRAGHWQPPVNLDAPPTPGNVA